MSPSPIRRTVALDGGTTNTRARLLLDDRIVATARRAVGVRDTVFTDGRHALAAAAREAIADVVSAAGGVGPDAIVAAGMLSSEVGLASVPHVIAPAGIDELARGAVVVTVPEVADAAILFVPGVRTPALPGVDGWAEADVMRGEECETFGVWSALPRPSDARATAFVWPGSHTKLVEVDSAGRIARSYTTLAGEMTTALARHTLLAASLPEVLPEDPDPESVGAGARLAAREGIGRAAFLVRIAALGDALDRTRRASFWIGAVIATDVAHLARHPILRGAGRVVVGGRQPQRRLYASFLRETLTALVSELDDELAESASAIGALAVAKRFRELHDA